MSSEVNVQTVKEEKKKRDKKILFILLAFILLAGVGAVSLAFYQRGDDETAWLQRELKGSEEKTITIDETIIITKPLTVEGNITLNGEGTIVYKPQSSQKLKLKPYQIPDDECQMMEVADLSEIDAAFVVSDGSSLTNAGNLTVDADNKGLGVKVAKNGTLTVSDSAVLTKGLGANILNDGTLKVSGGNLQAGDGYNVMSNGTLSVSGGEVTGSGKRMANIVSKGTLEMKGGKISGALGTNVYMLGGKAALSNGTIDGASIDNVFVEKGEISITGGTLSKGRHGVHNMDKAVITGGTHNGNTNNLYNEGSADVKSLSFGNSLAHNIVNTGKNARMDMTDVSIKSATSHGIYNIRGARMDAVNLKVESALSKGIHNGGGIFTGKDITVVRAGGAGVGNEIEKGWTEEGKVTIDGLKVLKANNYNLLNTSGVMTIHDAQLGLITTHSIQVTGGTLNLKNIDIEGTIGTNTAHGIYMLGGTIYAENVNIAKTVARGIQNRGGEFQGKNITLEKVAGTGVGNLVGVDGVSNGTITINGLTIKDVVGYAIQNTDAGTINISNATVNVSNTTAVRIDNGAINLNNVKIKGVTSKEKSANLYNGVTGLGGTLTLNNVSFKNMLGRGISNDGAKVIGTDITVDGIGGGAVVTLKGTTNITKLTTSNAKGYNVDVRGGSAKFADSTLNKGGTTSVCVKGGTLEFEKVLVNGAPAVAAEDGTISKYNGITASDGNLSLKDVTIQDTAGRGLNAEGSTVTGERLAIRNAMGTSIYNKTGSVSINGVEVSGSTGYNVDVQSGNVSLKNAILREGKTTNTHIKEGTLTLTNALIDGAPAIVDEKGKVNEYNGITADGGTLNLNDTTIRNTAARGLNNNKATVKGKNLVLENTGKTSLYNEKKVTIDGLVIKGHEGTEAYNIDNAGTLTIKNATLCKSGTSNMNLKQNSVTTLENVVVEGTIKGHAIYVRKNAALNFTGLTVKNSAARALSNGDANNKVDGGTITGKNLVVVATGGTAVANTTGTVKIDGFSISGRKGYGLDNSAVAELKNVNIEAYNSAAAINNSGSLTTESGTINAGTAYGIKHNSGTVTLGGTLHINTSSNAVYLGSAAAKLNFAKDATLITEGKINLPENNVITVLGKLGNTSSQKIAIDPAVTEGGTVYIDTPSQEIAQDIAAKDIFRPKGASAVVGEGDNSAKLVAGPYVPVEFDKEVKTVEVSTWAELKKVIETAKEGANLKIVLLKDINETAEGTITQGVEGNIKVVLTDDSRGYAIKRTDLTKALFRVDVSSDMTIEGTLTVDGASDSTTKADEAIILNEGTFTVGSGVIVKNGYKSGANNSLSGSGLSAGAIESNGILNINGTVTTSGSGNNSAISVLSGTLTTNGAKLNENVGRAVRIVSGTTVFNNTEICRNVVTAAASGGALLIDNGNITINGGTISYNVSKNKNSCHGAGIYMQGSANLTIKECTLEYNEAGGYGGAIASTSTGKVELTNCTLNHNKAGTHGGAVRVVKKDSTSSLVMKDCHINSNEAKQQAGAIISNAKTVTMENCILNGNKAGGYAGALYFNETSSQVIELRKCEVSNNTGATGTGGIRVDTGKTIMTGCKVNGNKVTNGDAGAIWATSAGEFILTDCEIAGNSAKKGGAILLDDKGAVSLNNCTVTGNRCTGDGGGGLYISHASAQVTVTGGSISNNTVSGRGGAVRIENGTIRITDCTMNDNTAAKSGGAFFINKYTGYHGKVYLTSCTMSGNASDGNGKTIHVKGTLSLKSCMLNGVSSVNADAVQLYKEGSPTVTNEE